MSKKPGIYFNLHKQPGNVWRATLKFQTSDEGDAVTVSGCCMGSWYDAVRKATKRARSLLGSPAALTAMTAVAPFVPGGLGALAALSVVNSVSAAGKKGKLKNIAPKIEDKTLRELARNMAQIADGKATSLSGGPMLLVEPDRETRALMGELREERDEMRKRAIARARDVIAWGKRNATTPEGRELVRNAERELRESIR